MCTSTFYLTMKKYVKSAEYKYYNANSRGSNVGDCTKRSISLAFDIPYTQVTKDLNRILKEEQNKLRRYDLQWTSSLVFPKLIQEYGGSTLVDVPEHPTQDEFADTHDGTYIVLSGKFDQYGSRSQGHACCIIDHVIYDSWNSKNHEVYGYFKISDPGQHKAETQIQDRFDELGSQALEMMEGLCYKFINKYQISGAYPEIATDIVKKGYSFKCKGWIGFSKSVPESKYLEPYDIGFVVVLTPTTSFEEAQEIIKKTVYQKVYDKFYYIRKDIASKKEAYELELAAGGSQKNDWLFMDGREQRFMKSLPSWVSSFVTYINIDRPNEFSDSVRLTIHPLPGDPRGTSGKIEFEGYNTSQVRDMIERYKKNWERPYDDYNPDEEY